MITLKDVGVVAIVGATIMGGLAIRECGRVNSIPSVVEAPKPHFPGCHDSAVVVPADTKVVCDEGASQTIEFWTGASDKFGGQWPMTVKCRCP